MVPRPLLRYHGGKWRIAPQIVAAFPPHDIYTEAFGGGGSVLLHKPVSKTEVYNDKCKEVVNVFQVMRDHGPELIRLLALTPFSRDEYTLAYRSTRNRIEAARRFIFRAHAGIGSDSMMRRNGFRVGMCDENISSSNSFSNLREAYPAIVERLRSVLIENRDAITVLKAFDYPRTLHYVDPPYVRSTRKSQRRGYTHEMDDAGHRRLAETLHNLKGMVVLSGYESPLYTELYSSWRRQLIKGSRDNVNNRRNEFLWFSPNCPDTHPELFE